MVTFVSLYFVAGLLSQAGGGSQTTERVQLSAQHLAACRALLAGGVFNVKELNTRELIRRRALDLVCTRRERAESTSADASLGLVLPVDGVPVPLDLGLSSSEDRSSLDSECRKSERQFDEDSALSDLRRFVSPVLVSKYVECVNSVSRGSVSGLTCSIVPAVSGRSVTLQVNFESRDTAVGLGRTDDVKVTPVVGFESQLFSLSASERQHQFLLVRTAGREDVLPAAQVAVTTKHGSCIASLPALKPRLVGELVLPPGSTLPTLVRARRLTFVKGVYRLAPATTYVIEADELVFESGVVFDGNVPAAAPVVGVPPEIRFPGTGTHNCFTEVDCKTWMAIHCPTHSGIQGKPGNAGAAGPTLVLRYNSQKGPPPELRLSGGKGSSGGVGGLGGAFRDPGNGRDWGRCPEGSPGPRGADGRDGVAIFDPGAFLAE